MPLTYIKPNNYKVMKPFLYFLFSTFSLISFAQKTDTLYILQTGNEYKLHFTGTKDTLFNEGDNYGNSLFIIDSVQNQNYHTDISTPYSFSSVNNELTIQISIDNTPQNKAFYSSHFNHVKTETDNSKEYNKLANFGSIRLKIKNNRIRYYFDNEKYSLIKDIDFKYGITTYNNSLKHQRYADANCKDFTEAYKLFNTLTWSALLRNSPSIISPKEYLSLEKVLVPCLGTKKKEEFLFFKNLIPLTYYK